MSRSVDLFVDSDLPLERLAVTLGEIVGLAFEAFPGGRRWWARCDDFAVHLGPHDYLPSSGLHLDQFRYVLSCDVALGSRLAQTPQALWLRRVADSLRRQGWPPPLLVLDLQYRDGEEPGAPRGRSAPEAPRDSSAGTEETGTKETGAEETGAEETGAEETGAEETGAEGCVR